MTDRTPMQRALDAEAKVTDLAKRVEVLEGALRPFDKIAGELFALNYNRADAVFSLIASPDVLRLKAGDFFDVRAALSTPSVGGSLAEENERLRERNSWHPMETCPYRTGVDLWCVYGGEEFARYEGGAPIGTLVPRRHRDETYEFFGNKNKNHVPRADSPDLIPVAWRYETPDPAPEMIAKTLGIPLTRDDAIARDAALSGKDRT